MTTSDEFPKNSPLGKSFRKAVSFNISTRNFQAISKLTIESVACKQLIEKLQVYLNVNLDALKLLILEFYFNKCKCGQSISKFLLATSTMCDIPYFRVRSTRVIIRLFHLVLKTFALIFISKSFVF